VLLECPNCATVFRINPRELPARGRKVQCSVCRHVWHAENTAPQPAATPPRSAPAMLGYRLVIIFLLLVMAAAIAGIFRQQISAGFPQTLALYEMAGLTIRPDTRSLAIRDLAGERQRDTIRLTGKIENTSHLPVHAPLFQITVTSGTGQVLAHQQMTLNASRINGQQALPFATQIQLDEDLPDAETTEISVVPLPRFPGPAE